MAVRVGVETDVPKIGKASGAPVRKASRVEAQWRAMEQFVRAGKAKAIGVSHYCKSHVQDILEIATIKPAVNQVQRARVSTWWPPCPGRLQARVGGTWP